MTKVKSKKQTGHSPTSWEESNWSYLQMELERLRLILQRRILWLRTHWKHDPLQEYQGLVISDAHADWLLAAEDLEAEHRYYKKDKSGSKITQSISNLEKKCEEYRQAMEKGGQSPALTAFSEIFGLSSFETDVLLLCLAPELDPTFERLYAYVQDDVTRKYATPQLAITLFSGTDKHSGLDRFTPYAPLRYSHLIKFESRDIHIQINSSNPMYIDERISNYLRGTNYIDHRLSCLLRKNNSLYKIPLHDEIIKIAINTVKTSITNGERPCINLVGAPGSGKESAAQQICNNLGITLFKLNLKVLFNLPQDERYKILRIIERDALLSYFAIYIDAYEVDFTDKEQVNNTNNIIEDLYISLFIGSSAPWHNRRNPGVFHLPKIDNDSMILLWQQGLKEISIQKKKDIINNIVQQFEFGPEAITFISKNIMRQKNSFPWSEKFQFAEEDLWQMCRKYMKSSMDGLAQPIVSKFIWRDIILPDDTINLIRELADQVSNRSVVYESWGFGEKLIRGRGISALFSGSSGTGKTMAAEILANHLNLDLFRIDLASLVSKYIGETEKNIKKVFDKAEQGGAILFFDEADALFSKRTEVRDSHDRYANLEVNYLLQRMEDYKGLAILATNKKSQLDSAFTRRLRFIIDFPFPDATNRKKIWEKIFPAKTPINGVDYNTLARLEISGGSIKNIALNTAFLAAEKNKPVSMPLIIHAARREYAKINKMISSSEFGKFYQLVKS